MIQCCRNGKIHTGGCLTTSDIFSSISLNMLARASENVEEAEQKARALMSMYREVGDPSPPVPSSPTLRAKESMPSQAFVVSSVADLATVTLKLASDQQVDVVLQDGMPLSSLLQSQRDRLGNMALGVLETEGQYLTESYNKIIVQKDDQILQLKQELSDSREKIQTLENAKKCPQVTSSPAEYELQAINQSLQAQNQELQAEIKSLQAKHATLLANQEEALKTEIEKLNAENVELTDSLHHYADAYEGMVDAWQQCKTLKNDQCEKLKNSLNDCEKSLNDYKNQLETVLKLKPQSSGGFFGKRTARRPPGAHIPV